ncbi:hypothetical protein Hanom_Chr06g00520621 [Helianthus anomalus]
MKRRIGRVDKRERGVIGCGSTVHDDGGVVYSGDGGGVLFHSIMAVGSGQIYAQQRIKIHGLGLVISWFKLQVVHTGSGSSEFSFVSLSTSIGSGGLVLVWFWVSVKMGR